LIYIMKKMSILYFTNFEIKLLQTFLNKYSNPDNFITENSSQLDIQGFYLYKSIHNDNNYMFILAKFYQSINRNSDSIRWLAEASKRNNMEASENLYEKIIDSFYSKNKKKLFEISLSICENENWKYCFSNFIEILAKCYSNGIGTTINIDQAKLWFKRGILRDNINCLCNYALLIMKEGRELKNLGFVEYGEKCINEGVKYILEAKEKEPRNNFVNLRLFDMLIHGEGIKQDYIKGYELLLDILSGQGYHGAAYFHIGLFYSGEYHMDIQKYPNFPRDVIKIDRQLAFCYFKKSANNSSINGIVYMARILENLVIPEIYFGYSDIIPLNMKKSFTYYEKGFQRFNPECCYKAGLFYENYGKYAGVVEQNYEKAKERYKRGAECGDINCISRLNEIELL